MKVAMSWFNDFTDISDIEPKQYADALTMSGTMVEGVEALGAELVNVVTGKITEITKHENADSLQVCMLDVGNGEPLQIVTGATNVTHQLHDRCQRFYRRYLGHELLPGPPHGQPR